MRVNTKQAVKLFFQNPSLEQVFKGQFFGRKCH